MIILQILLILLTITAAVLLRKQYQRNQIERRVHNQIKNENKIWNEILKQKDINNI